MGKNKMRKILVTDGSGAADGCGGSAVVYDNGSVHIHLFQYVQSTSVDTSAALEAASLFYGLKQIAPLKPSEYHVFCDAQSVVANAKKNLYPIDAIQSLTQENISKANNPPKTASLEWVRGHTKLKTATLPERLNHIADTAARLAAKRMPLKEAAPILQNYTKTVLPSNSNPADVTVTIHELYEENRKDAPVVSTSSYKPGTPQFIQNSIYTYGCEDTRTGIALYTTGRQLHVHVLKFSDSYKYATINELTAAAAFILGAPAQPKHTNVYVTDPHIVTQTQKMLRSRAIEPSLGSSQNQLLSLHTKKTNIGYRCSVEPMHLSVKPKSPTRALKYLLGELSGLSASKSVVGKVKEAAAGWGFGCQDIQVQVLQLT